MKDSMEVYFECGDKTRLVGKCHFHSQHRRQSSVFQYAESWLAYGGAFALDPANLPLSKEPHYVRSGKSELPGALRDSAPDRWGRLLTVSTLQKSGKTRTLSEVEYLTPLNDRTRIGALRYRYPDEIEFTCRSVPALTRLPSLLKAANAVYDHTETADDLQLLLNEGSPLGGARPKATVIDQDGSLALAKFPKPDDARSIILGEILALTLARKAGLRVAVGRVVPVKEQSVALIRRFDRKNNRRIPFLSAMSLLGLSDGETGTYTDIATCIRRYSSAPTADLHELWRRVVFGVLIGNLDDHLRNHGFLYDCENRWRLSPAYDLNPVPLHEKPRVLETWISEEGPEADLELAYRAAPYLALQHADAKRIVNEVSNALKSWGRVARQLGMTRSDIDTYATAIAVSPA